MSRVTGDRTCWVITIGIVVACILLSIISVANAAPRKPIPITVVGVGMSAEEAGSWYGAAGSYLPTGLTMMGEVVESTPVNSSKPVLKRYKDDLCGRYGVSGGVILVLDEHGGGVIGQSNICLKNRSCTLAYVSVNKNQPWETLVAIVHEILHALGALHIGGCNIMRPGIISCPGMFTIKRKTLEQVRQCLR